MQTVAGGSSSSTGMNRRKQIQATRQTTNTPGPSNHIADVIKCTKDTVRVILILILPILLTVLSFSIRTMVISLVRAV